MSTSTAASFLGLPAELRNAIYDLVLHNPKDDKTVRQHQNPNSRCGILATCRQIRQETLPMFYALNHFVLQLRACSTSKFQAAVNSLWTIKKHIKQTSKGVNFGGFKIQICGTIWPNLLALRPLLHFVRETGFHPATEAQRRQYREAIKSGDRTSLERVASASMFKMSIDDHVILQAVLEEAVLLALDAHDRGISSSALDKAFGELVRRKTRYGKGRARLMQHWRRKRRVAEKRQRLVTRVVQASFQQLAI
ncbi:hypothetical protein B0A50_03914 [Salinomyces thailandicus]|uniref:F-box domain-containing protein n=1 Tax=Salinomyces thailandicus TaxID=706561 RepID=A0A4U0U0Z0_9PEZI|nr:hypothetical protein B0A50_03914 [Salinomyces thailandica]